MSESEALLFHPPASEELLKKKVALVESGNIAFDQENYEKALDCFHKASLIDGSDAEVWCLLGMSYANLDFPREAWRSYKLALHVDTDNVDALWYAGEFLFNMDDMELAGMLLTRYASLEKDEEKLNETREMLEEVRANLNLDGEETGDPRKYSGVNAEGDEVEDLDDELQGMEIEDGELGAGVQDYDDDDDGFDLAEEEGGGEFVAGLALQLSGMQAKCQSCQTAIPDDAPYCYSCRTPHFYE